MAGYFNRRLARGIVVFGVVAGVVSNLYVALYPDAAATRIQSLSSKWLIMVAIDLLLVTAGLLVYARYYEPRVKRLCLNLIRGIWVLGFLTAGFPWALQQILVKAEITMIKAEISLQHAGIASAVSFITVVAGSYFFSKLYYSAAKQEAKIGREL